MQQELQKQAEAGNADAQLRLAMELDRDGRHQDALHWLRAAAERGHAAAQHVLGARLVVGRAAPFQPEEGARWISTAARQGMPDAIALMALLTSLSGDWQTAFRLMGDAGQRGNALAKRQMALLTDSAQIDLKSWSAPCAPNWRAGPSRIGIIERFAPPALCRWIIERAHSRLQDTRLKGSAESGGEHASHRTGSGAGFSLLDSDLVIQLINARIADVLGIPMTHQEPTNVLRYQPGEEYRPHFDTLTESGANAAELQATGQRTTTVLVYLNDDYEGGETEFPRLDWRYRGRTGDALVFWSVTPAGVADPDTLHAGLPVRRGEKWIYSKWIRAKPYPLV